MRSESSPNLHDSKAYRDRCEDVVDKEWDDPVEALAEL